MQTTVIKTSLALCLLFSWLSARSSAEGGLPSSNQWHCNLGALFIVDQYSGNTVGPYSELVWLRQGKSNIAPGLGLGYFRVADANFIPFSANIHVHLLNRPRARLTFTSALGYSYADKHKDVFWEGGAFSSQGLVMSRKIGHSIGLNIHVTHTIQKHQLADPNYDAIVNSIFLQRKRNVQFVQAGIGINYGLFRKRN